jgi:hypothetical protein
MTNEIRVSTLDGTIEVEAGDPSFGGYDSWVGYFPPQKFIPFVKSLGNLKRNKGKIVGVEEDGYEMEVLYDLKENGVGTKGKFTIFFTQHQELLVKEENIDDTQFKAMVKDMVTAIKSL